MRFKAMVAVVFLLSGMAFSQSFALTPVPKQHFLDNNGLPLPGGKLCSYSAGTSTPLATYSDSSGTANTNPVVLDSAGRATVYLSAASYKLSLLTAGTDNTCSTGVQIWSQDNVFDPGLLLLGTNNTWTGSNTFTGTLTVANLNFVQWPSLAGDAGANINAACSAAPVNGGLVLLPAGTGIVSTSITCKSHVTIMGAGVDATVLTSTGGSLGANPIFNFAGISASHLTNLRVSGLTYSNGIANSTNYTIGKDGIDSNFVDGLEIDHVRATQIQGPYAIMLRNTTHWHIHDITLDNFTYCGFCQNSDNQFGDLHDFNIGPPICVPANGGNCPQVYTVASGNDGVAGTNYSGDYRVHDGWVTNPHWDAYDAHGGSNITFGPNLKADNVAICANVQIAVSAFVTNLVGSNLRAKGITCNQGTGDKDQAGFNVSGDGGTNKYYWNGFNVEDVTLIGFGSTATAANDINSAFQFSYALRGVFSNSTCKSYNQSCINVNVGVQGMDILGNHAIDLAGLRGPTPTAFLRFGPSNLSYNIRVIGNSLEATNAAGVPAVWVRAGSTWALGGLIFRDNHINVQPTVTLYSNAANIIPVLKATVPTLGLVQGMGETVTNSQGQIGWTVCSTTGGTCNTTSTGLGSLDVADTVVTGNMTSGTTPGTNDVLTVTGNGSVNGVGADYRWLPIGMNIIVAGAGVAAANLSCQVASFDNSGASPKITLITAAGASCFASTSVTGANVTYQGLVYGTYSVDGNGNTVGLSFSAPTFKVTNGAFAASITTSASANRAQTDPDAAGTFLLTGNGNSPIQSATAAGCATGAAIGAACTTAVSWTTAFADTNYKVACNGVAVTSGVPVDGGLTAKANGSVTFQTVATTAAAAQFTNISCLAVHD